MSHPDGEDHEQEYYDQEYLHNIYHDQSGDHVDYTFDQSLHYANQPAAFSDVPNPGHLSGHAVSDQGHSLPGHPSYPPNSLPPRYGDVARGLTSAPPSHQSGASYPPGDYHAIGGPPSAAAPHIGGAYEEAQEMHNPDNMFVTGHPEHHAGNPDPTGMLISPEPSSSAAPKPPPAPYHLSEAGRHSSGRYSTEQYRALRPFIKQIEGIMDQAAKVTQVPVVSIWEMLDPRPSPPSDEETTGSPSTTTREPIELAVNQESSRDGKHSRAVQYVLKLRELTTCPTKTSRASSEEGYLPCPKCHKLMKDGTSLLRHLENSDPHSVFLCSQCEDCFHRRDQLTAHLRQKHSLDNDSANRATDQAIQYLIKWEGDCPFQGCNEHSTDFKKLFTRHYVKHFQKRRLSTADRKRPDSDAPGPRKPPDPDDDPDDDDDDYGGPGANRSSHKKRTANEQPSSRQTRRRRTTYSQKDELGVSLEVSTDETFDVRGIYDGRLLGAVQWFESSSASEKAVKPFDDANDSFEEQEPESADADKNTDLHARVRLTSNTHLDIARVLSDRAARNCDAFFESYRPEIGRYKCIRCRSHFSSKEKWLRHIDFWDPQKIYVCPKHPSCKRLFSTAASFEFHAYDIPEHFDGLGACPTDADCVYIGRKSRICGFCGWICNEWESYWTLHVAAHFETEHRPLSDWLPDSFWLSLEPDSEVDRGMLQSSASSVDSGFTSMSPRDKFNSASECSRAARQDISPHQVHHVSHGFHSSQTRLIQQVTLSQLETGKGNISATFNKRSCRDCLVDRYSELRTLTGLPQSFFFLSLSALLCGRPGCMGCRLCIPNNVQKVFIRPNNGRMRMHSKDVVAWLRDVTSGLFWVTAEHHGFHRSGCGRAARDFQRMVSKYEQLFPDLNHVLNIRRKPHGICLRFEVVSEDLWIERGFEASYWQSERTRVLNMIRRSVALYCWNKKIVGQKILQNPVIQSSDEYYDVGNESSLARQQILRTLSMASSSAKYHSLKEQRTESNWLFRSEEFQDWIAGGTTDCVWLTGSPGSGKSTLTSAVLDALHQKAHAIGVAYFFFDTARCGEQTLEYVLSGIVGQLQENQSRNAGSWRPERSTKRGFLGTFKGLIDVLYELCNDLHRTFMIIDGLDECNDEVRESLLEIISIVRPSGRLSIWVSSRYMSEIEDRFTDATRIEMPKDRTDIFRYLASRAEDLHPSMIHEKDLRHQIVEVLKRGAHNLFLWAKLAFDQLQEKLTQADLVRALQAIPPTIEGVYEQSLAAMKDRPKFRFRHAARTLLWIVHARRPLTLPELTQALSSEEGDVKQAQSVDEKSIIESCRPFVQVDSYSRSLEFMHGTVKEFLIHRSEQWFEDGHQEIATSCLKFLTTSKATYKPAVSVEELQARVQQNPFLEYCCTYWHAHTSLSQQHESWEPLALALFQDQSRLNAIAQVTDYAYHYQRTCIIDVRILELRWPSGLSLAIGRSSYVTVEKLVQRGADPDKADAYGRTPLHMAASLGAVEICKLLITQGHANVNWPTSTFSTPLHSAIQGQTKHSADIVHLLLNHPDIDPERRDIRGRTPLCLATALSLHDVVELLLTHGAYPDARDYQGQTPLFYAAHEGNFAAATLLLEIGADPHAVNCHGKSPSMVAQDAGHQALVELLQSSVSTKDVKSRNEAE